MQDLHLLPIAYQAIARLYVLISHVQTSVAVIGVTAQVMQSQMVIEEHICL